MRRFLTLFTVLMLYGVLAFSQSRVVTGTVTDQNGNPVPFATVSETGARNTVVADANGNYSIRLNGTREISISAAGFTAATTTISGNSAPITLQRGTGQLQEIVVTALGIQRQKKELGYSTAKVNAEELVQSRPVNVANGLQGKVSGLNITSINNGVFEDVKINLRGIRSLTGNNNPLLLLDGVQTPLGYLSSINPQDIQDVNILKGPQSAAIYGPDARNGVIVVTTKRSGSIKNPQITVSHTTQFSNISFFPELQTQFGSGGSGDYIPYENWSWGPAFDGSIRPIGRPLEDGSQQYLKYTATNDRKKFFNTGTTNQTDVSLAVKDFYLSLQDARIKGIVPDDENRRTGIRVNAGRDYGKFRINTNLNYIQSNYDIFDDIQMENYQIGQNVGNNGGLLNLIFNTPAHIPIQNYKDFRNNPYATYNGYFNDYGLNPYLAIDNWREAGKIEDFLANLDISAKLTNSFSFTWRGAATMRNTNEFSRSRGYTPSEYAATERSFKLIPSSASQSFARSSRISSEAFITFTKNIRDFKVTAIAGNYVRQSDTRANSVGANNLIVTDLFNVGSRSGELVGANSVTRDRLVSAFGSLALSYKGWANIEATGRNDWSSLLALENNSFFYPGVSGSLVLSDAIPSIKSSPVSYLKLRAAWAKSGSTGQVTAYSLQPTFAQASGFPYGTLPGYTANNVSPDPLLKPEFTKSTEFGIELGFLKNRINIEAAYYTQDNTNQIINVATSSATGYTSALVNAASFENRGFEVDLKLTPLVNLGAVKVNFKGNASYNDSKINSLYKGIDQIFIGGYQAAGNYAVVGAPAFVFKASDYVRDSLGRVIVDRTTGLPTTDPNNKQYGRTMPLWTVGLNPTIQWKNINFSVVAEYKGGHMAFANIGAEMAWTGVSKATAQNNREPFVLPNSVYDDGTGKLVENTDVVIQDVNNYFTGAYRATNSNFLHSASSWRIREVSLGYDLPISTLGNQKIIKGLTVTLTARNLFLWVPESNQFTDPDFNFTTTNASGVSTSQINPATRTLGANVTIKF